MKGGGVTQPSNLQGETRVPTESQAKNCELGKSVILGDTFSFERPVSCRFLHASNSGTSESARREYGAYQEQAQPQTWAQCTEGMVRGTDQGERNVVSEMKR